MNKNPRDIYVSAAAEEFRDLGTERAHRLYYKLQPKIEHVGIRNDFSEYRIIISPFANILCAMMCADTNASFHTKAGGFLQTIPIIGICSIAASLFCPGYELKVIRPEVSFDAPVPIGAPVTLALKEIRKKRMGFAWLELRAWLEHEDMPLFSPRELVMSHIPNPS